MMTDPEFARQDMTFVIGTGVKVTQRQFEQTFGKPPVPNLEFLPHRKPAGYQYTYRFKKKIVTATFDASPRPGILQIDEVREMTITALP
jgi:hypothetical protein